MVWGVRRDYTGDLDDDPEERSRMQEDLQDYIYERNPHMVEWLVGIFPKIATYDIAPLLLAAHIESVRIAEILLQAGAKFSREALSAAIHTENLELIRLIGGAGVAEKKKNKTEEGGIDVNCIKKDGFSVFHLACANHAPIEVLEYLITIGADVHVKLLTGGSSIDVLFRMYKAIPMEHMIFLNDRGVSLTRMQFEDQQFSERKCDFFRGFVISILLMGLIHIPRTREASSFLDLRPAVMRRVCDFIWTSPFS